MSEHEIEDHDLGLSHDLPRLARRGLLGLFGGAGAVALVACGTGDDDTTLTGSTTTAQSEPPGGQPPARGGGGADAESAVEVGEGEIPEETAGPYPGDGSNGVNVLSESGIVRSDLTRSFGSASGVAEGVPVTVELTVYDLNGSEVSPLAGAALYLWHCDREGRYSMYSEGITDENYLRGVQETAADGTVRFTTIFPACYDGRWPHMHFEVYESLDSATTYTNKLRTSQLALPEATCREVYGVADGYDASVDNLDRVSLDSDNVFSDGYSLQLASVTGSVEEGYTLSLKVPV
ncbi:intradiol ring-cleavage dioxygenase [Nocardioides anomalus]|uniref:Intradiol ring-cleavage dioxygenase n=1 Tax=Nocardioides anomalus TaxID=2712223 RepID=A0A6G6WBL1_9ACTN|nr:intradiol ring-cleavage dioxygenase [Nocardioides anomalus]QIG42718.1 intradiol ring-cleavage dioxygenase [Nocardioides anomalus]